MLARPPSLPPDTPVYEVMTAGVVVVSANATIRACAAAMARRGTHAVLVLDPQADTALGWISQHDILVHAEDHKFMTLAGQAVSQEAAFIEPRTSVQEACRRMVAERRSHLLVAASEEAVPLGVVSAGDLVAFYATIYGHGS